MVVYYRRGGPWLAVAVRGWGSLGWVAVSLVNFAPPPPGEGGGSAGGLPASEHTTTCKGLRSRVTRSHT